MTTAAHVAAVDIGGTKIAVGLVDRDGVLLRSDTVPTPAADGPEAVLDAAASAVLALGGAPLAVGVGSAGVIDAACGVVTSATDALPGWPGTDLRGGMAVRLGLPVEVDNDVHAHAIGEVWLGAAAGSPTVLLVAVGTGVGGSLVVNGKVHHGAHSAAGHVGHTAVPSAEGAACTCGSAGHAEAVGSGPAMLAAFRARSGAPVTRLSEVSALADGGDAEAAAVLSKGAAAVGEAIGGLVNVLDPDVVLIGGGVSGCGGAWWWPLRETVAAQVLPPLRGIRLATGALGTHAALFGAARLGWSAGEASGQ